MKQIYMASTTETRKGHTKDNVVYHQISLSATLASVGKPRRYLSLGYERAGERERESTERETSRDVNLLYRM